MTIETILKQYDFNLKYAEALVQDLSDEQMTTIPSNGLENHPAWTIGHLVSGSAGLAEDLGEKFEMPDTWADLFLRKGPGDPRKPDPDKSKYPPKEQLLEELNKQHNKVRKLLLKYDSADLNKKIKWRFESCMPSLLDLIVFMCINHEATHLGQLAAWRRAMGLNSALSTL
jgi:hypothetical protein